jgi:hypothetical protein
MVHQRAEALTVAALEEMRLPVHDLWAVAFAHSCRHDSPRPRRRGYPSGINVRHKSVVSGRFGSATGVSVQQLMPNATVWASAFIASDARDRKRPATNHERHERRRDNGDLRLLWTQ